MRFPPMIMLHYVSDDPNLDSLKPYCITRNTFSSLLKYLSDNNYETITFSDLINGDKNNNGRKKVILTFDDCARHLFDFAIPELQKNNFKAVFYMPTAFIGAHNDWDIRTGKRELELMRKEDLISLDKVGMEIGSHSHDHHRLGEIKNEDDIINEAGASKKILEEIIGKPVLSFAYPYGSVPKNYKTILNSEGYQFGITIYSPYQNRFSLRRFIYHDGDTAKTLSQKLSGLYKWYRYFSDPFKKN